MKNSTTEDFPQLEGLDIAGYSLPAMVVGGDYYDFIQYDPAHLVTVIGDVMGKGVGAASLMRNLRSSLRALLADGNNPRQLLPKLNTLLFPVLQRAGAFITFYIAIYHMPSQKMFCTNAGHHSPILCHAGGTTELLQPKGIALGLQDGYRYDDHRETVLEPGDVMVFYTDGVIDARNPQGERFGLSRLCNLIADNRRLDAIALRKSIAEAVQQFCNGCPQKDDITFSVLKVKEGIPNANR